MTKRTEIAALKRRMNLQGPLPSYFNLFANDEKFNWISPLLDSESFRCGDTVISRQERAAKAWDKIRVNELWREEVEAGKDEEPKEIEKPKQIHKPRYDFFRGDFVMVKCYKNSRHLHLHGMIGIVCDPMPLESNQYRVRGRYREMLFDVTNMQGRDLRLILGIGEKG